MPALVGIVGPLTERAWNGWMGEWLNGLAG